MTMPPINLIVTHNIMKLNHEKRYDNGTTIGNFKNKMVMICGSNPSDMIVQLKDAAGGVLKTLQPDDATFADLGVTNNAYIHIVDTNPKGGVAEQMANFAMGIGPKVEKYEIDEKKYNARDDTFKKFKETKLKKFSADKQAEKEALEKKWDELASDWKVGDRCETNKPGFKHRGEIMYIGRIEGTRSTFVGIKLDEPFGKNDGTAKGKRLFVCEAKYGIFMRPTTVKVGDYPPLDDFDDTDEEL